MQRSQYKGEKSSCWVTNYNWCNLFESSHISSYHHLDYGCCLEKRTNTLRNPPSHKVIEVPLFCNMGRPFQVITESEGNIRIQEPPCWSFKLLYQFLKLPQNQCIVQIVAGAGKGIPTIIPTTCEKNDIKVIFWKIVNRELPNCSCLQSQQVTFQDLGPPCNPTAAPQVLVPTNNQ